MADPVPGPGGSPARYAIRVQEHLAGTWAEWFDGFEFTHTADGGSVMTGLVLDQAALHGLLAKVRDLNLTLLSVSRLQPDASPGGNHEGLRETRQDPTQAAV